MKVSNRMPVGRRMLAVSLLAAIAVAIGVLLYAMNAPVQIVRVTGDLTTAERDAVQAAVAQRVEGGLLTVNLDQVVGNVVALTWPRDVRARRVWPSIIEVSVAKDPIVARWGDGFVLNSVGDVVDAAGLPDATLPLIRCANANGARAMQIFQMLGQVLSDTSLKVAEVDEDALGEWRVRFTNDVTVALGHEDLLERVERFARVYRAVIEQHLDDVDHIDARYRNGVAVGWRGADAGKFQVAMSSHKTEVIQ
jgi:cell division protein FtsQ